MTTKSMAAVAAVLLVMAPAAANAQMIEGLGLLVPQPMLTTDYRFDGLSSSNGEPVPQLSLYLWRPDKLYAGVFVTGVNYGYAGSPSWELDIYGGRHFDFPVGRLTVEGMATTFPDAKGAGPSLDFVQGKVKLERKIGPLTASGSVAYTPSASYGSGEAWAVKSEASYDIRPWLALKADVGKRYSELGQDRAFWSVGAKVSGKQLALDVRYMDTDLDRSQCFFTDWCEPAVVATLTYTPPVIPGSN